MRKHFPWLLFIAVTVLSVKILETSGIDTQSREMASLNDLRNETIQKHSQVIDSKKLGALNNIQSILKHARGPSSLKELN